MSSLRHKTTGETVASSPRDDYLDAARTCILDVGWRRTTLTEVARRAGVSRMTIYRTWADMPSLLGDLMTREWSTVASLASLTDDDVTTPGGLATTSLAVVRGLRGNELFGRIVELDPELLLPYLVERRGRSQQGLVELLAGAITAGQDAGRMRACDPTVMARGLVLAAHGFVLSAHTMTDDDVALDALDEELRLLVERTVTP